MDMKRIIRKRAVSLFLAFLMAASCTFNIAAADSDANYVDSQNENSAQRVYDSGNVVLSNEVVPVKEDTYKIKLNIDIHNIDKFLLKDSSVLIDGETADDVSSSSGTEQNGIKDSGAPGLAAGMDAAVKAMQSLSAVKSAFSISDYPAISSRALADAEPAAAELEESKYEVRYYIEKGFKAVESSIPESAEMKESKSGPYVSWPDLSLDEVKNFTNGVQVQKDDTTKTESQTVFAASSEQKSGLYQEGVELYAFNIAAVADPYYYVPVNLYKYNRDPVSSSNSRMKINQEAYNMAAAAQRQTSKSVRGLSFDKVTNLSSAFNGDWNKYNDAIFPGIVNNELDDNGNLRWAETSSYKYVSANLFGPKDDSTSNYRTDYANVAFPLLKGANGSYSFDSKIQRGVYNSQTNKVEIRENQDITYQKNDCAQFSPFYTGAGDQDSTADRNASWSFGMNMNIQFSMPKDGKLEDDTPMRFDFSGDDDVWIFIDKKLVLDIGGIHQAKNGSIDFSSGTARTSDANDNEVAKCNIYSEKNISRTENMLHTLSIFYLERGAGYSNFKMSCNLLQSSAFEVGKKLEGQTGNQTFQFNAVADGLALANVPFEIYNVTGTSTGESGETNASGNFSLRAGQKAVFSYSNDAVSRSIAGKAIQVKELGAEEYSTSWVATKNFTATDGLGKEAPEIQLPASNGIAGTVDVIFTNWLSPGITIDKSASLKSDLDRTYYIDLTASTDDISASPESEATTSSISIQPITATVRDAIDPRFDVIAVGDMDVSQRTDNGSGIDIGDNGRLYIPSSGPAYVVWTNQTIPVADDEWSKRITIKAKNEFIGGNNIVTNVRENSYASFISEGSGKTETKYFPQPTVNVRPRFYLGNTQNTIFLGEAVPPAALEPYTLDKNGSQVTGNAMYCGLDPTGTFSYQWSDAGGAAIAGATDKVFPSSPKLYPGSDTSYTLAAWFTPNGSNSKTPNTVAPGDHREGKYTVNVRSGSVTITKTITNVTNVANMDKGRSFVFLVTGTAAENCKPITPFYVTLTMNGSSTQASKTITGLSKGKYTVTEINSNWQYDRGPVQWADSKSDLGYQQDAVTKEFSDISISATCENTYSHNQWFSATDSVANLFQ